MKKLTNILLIIIILLVTALGVLTPITFFSKKHPSYEKEFTDRITVSDEFMGKVDPASTMISRHIDYEDDYIISYSWVFEGTDRNDILNMEPKNNVFLTSIIISDENYNEIYTTVAGSIMADTRLHLEPGTYFITFTHHATRESFISFAKEYLCSDEEAENMADAYDFDNYVTNGEFDMNYYIKFTPQINTKLFSLWISLFAITMIFVLVLIIVSFTLRKKNLPDYDERQELIRGKAYRTGFYATLVFIGFAIVLDSTNSLPFLDSTILYGTTVLGGVLVFAVYCVWNEAYFGLNQKSSTAMFILAFIGILNLFIGIMNYFKGNLFFNGKLSFSFMNFVCAFMFIVLFATILLKKISNKVNDDKERNEPIDDED